MIDDVLKEILCFWEMFKNCCLSLPSLWWGCRWCAQSLNSEWESTIKQLKYVNLKENTRCEWGYNHSTLSKDTSEQNVKV